MRKHEYGFTLIEFIVILALCTTIIGLSLNGYSNFSKKNQKKSSTSLANKVYYHLITYINYARNFYTKKIDGVTYNFSTDEELHTYIIQLNMYRILKEVLKMK